MIESETSGESPLAPGIEGYTTARSKTAWAIALRDSDPRLRDHAD